MIYIGYIINRNTSGVEILTAESFDELEVQVEDRYTQLREEHGWEEPEDDEEDELGERYDWNYVSHPGWSKEKINAKDDHS